MIRAWWQTSETRPRGTYNNARGNYFVDRSRELAASAVALDIWLAHLRIYRQAPAAKLILKNIRKVQKWNKRGQIEIRSWPLLRSRLLQSWNAITRGFSR